MTCFFCSLDKKPIRSMEGFLVSVDMSLELIDKVQIRSFIISGENVPASINETKDIGCCNLSRCSDVFCGSC